MNTRIDRFVWVAEESGAKFLRRSVVLLLSLLYREVWREEKEEHGVRCIGAITLTRRKAKAFFVVERWCYVSIEYLLSLMLLRLSLTADF